MVYSYKPTYYSTLHDSITSLCKTVLPFSKKRRLPAAEQKQSKMQSDNLKWQQDSFHQMLNLMGLHKEGILAESEVSSFRCHLLDTLITSPAEQEFPAILRDKLLFLQELLYAKCISEDEYHFSKRPLLQRMAVQGAEIEARDVIDAKPPKEPNDNTEEEWSFIDLKDEKCLLSQENSYSKNKAKHSSTMKQIKGAASYFGFGKNKEERSIFDIIESNPQGNNSHLKGKENEPRSILMMGSTTEEAKTEPGSRDKTKRKAFRSLFQREQREEHGPNYEEIDTKSIKKQLGFDGFKKWSKNGSEDETADLPLNEKKIKSTHKNGSSSDFFIDKVLGEEIKKELLRIQTQLNTSNPNVALSDDQIETISIQLPVEKSELKKLFPKSWCDRYGDVVLDVVRKEFKDHMGQMGNLRAATRERRNSNPMRWTTRTFDHNNDDDENFHPNLFAHKDKGTSFSGRKTSKLSETNPFSDYTTRNGNGNEAYI